jgi:teichuronic acid biosynthesis glycosyltransferase TuaG
MAGDLVSVVVPAYNAGKYIADTIRSVIAQTWSDWELIVVDDGSTDDTAAIVHDFVKRESRVKYFFQENGRLGKARNTGIKNSNADLIAFLDSDDLWLETKLELQMRALREHNADIVYCNAYVFTDDNPFDETKTLPTSSGLFSGPAFFDSLNVQNQIPVLTVLAKKTALESAGLFEEIKCILGCEDYDLWLKLAKAGFVFYGMPAVLARYRRHAAAMTAIRSNALKAMLLTIQRHIDDSSLSEAEKRKLLTGLYRALIAALIDEGKIGEAKQLVHELYSCNRKSIVTRLQKLLIDIWPQQYNFISRECLYRTEWHLQNTFGRRKPQRP